VEIFSGIDLVEIARFQNLDPAIRKRFFTRVFSANELEYIKDIDQRAAGIFAAKEACAKALGCGIGSVRWVDIEITHTAENQPNILLHADALDRSNEKHILSWSVSITHTRETAAAVVVAAAS
jgi:holo-[acyl-carrier protein] synthase